MSKSGKSSISVIVPVWNEEAGIPQLREGLVQVQELLRDYGEMEFVFVDDGSTDGTQSALHRHFELAGNYRVVAHERNQGVGAAFRSGFRHARGEIVCTIDSDCSYRPHGLQLLVQALESGGDIAVASPYHPQGRVEGVPWWRLALSKCCSWGYRRIAPVPLYTYTSIFRAYRRRVIETVSFQGNGFVSASEILVNAARQGYRIVEVPMTLHARRTGHSKMKVARTARAHLQMMRSLISKESYR